MTNKDDIRYQSTEQAIRDAALKLAKEGDIEKISVTKLCKVAHISRNAFYQHYANAANLCSTMIDEVMMDIRKRCLRSSEKVISSNELDTTLTTTIIDALADHERLLRTVLPSDSGTLSRRLADGITESYVDAALMFGEHGASLEHRLSCSFAAWGLIGLLRCWLANTNLPITEAAPYFEAMQVGISSKATDYLLRK